jgi:hypothetical protein
MKAVSALGLGGVLVVGACPDITNPNAPTEIGDNASAARIAAAMEGLLMGARADVPSAGSSRVVSSVAGVSHRRRGSPLHLRADYGDQLDPRTAPSAVDSGRQNMP